MDLYLKILTIVNILIIVISLVAIYRSSNNTIDSDINYIEKIMEHIELEKCIKKKEKETNYEQAVKDILDTLPEGSVEIINQPFSNTIIIKIQKNVFKEG